MAFVVELWLNSVVRGQKDVEISPELHLVQLSYLKGNRSRGLKIFGTSLSGKGLL